MDGLGGLVLVGLVWLGAMKLHGTRASFGAPVGDRDASSRVFLGGVCVALWHALVCASVW